MHTSLSRLPLTVATGLLAVTPLLAQDPPKKELIRLNNYIGGPDYLRFSGSHRTRFESLNGQFRANSPRNSENQLHNRSLIRIDYSRNAWGATLEGIDARVFGTKDNSFANTTTVNTFDILQAFASFDFGNGHSVAAGRFTMDVGSRRLVARNRFRNTINSFNGVRWDYSSPDNGDYQAGAFWTMPTHRRPDDRMMLVDNEHDWDTQTLDMQFFGAHAQTRIDEGSTGQVYLFGTDDTRGNRDEQIFTVGGRYYRPKQRGKVSAEVEAAYQFGERWNDDIDAHFAHASVGYTCDCDMQPTIRLAIDVASGNDGGSDYSRFNTLFGARRFEYGPTGIYGALGRRNMISPEIRVSMKPCPTTWLMFGFRDIQLHSGSDSWVEAGDNTGSGRSIGQQTEMRLRWEPCPKNMRFEGGFAYLSGGRFRDTSNRSQGDGSSDTSYFFLETIFTF